jgi:type IV pilus assembly protein PilV
MIRKKKNTQSGMTLIEVLASIVVLSIGLIGVAALQMHGLRNVKVNGDVQAVAAHVHELAELMRLNTDNAADYDGLTNSTCSNVQTLADDDFCNALVQCQQKLASANLSMSVSSCATAGSTCVIQAQWTPRVAYGVSGAATPQTYTLNVQL